MANRARSQGDRLGYLARSIPSTAILWRPRHGRGLDGVAADGQCCSARQCALVGRGAGRGGGDRYVDGRHTEHRVRGCAARRYGALYHLAPGPALPCRGGGGRGGDDVYTARTLCRYMACRGVVACGGRTECKVRNATHPAASSPWCTPEAWCHSTTPTIRSGGHGYGYVRV